MTFPRRTSVDWLCYLARRAAFVLVALGLGVSGCQGALVQYVESGRTDFDTVIKELQPYGSWSQNEGKTWVFTPRDHAAPYTNGRWLYTDFGWYWQSNVPYGWATEHYGYWKRGQDHVWAWYPGPDWLPQIVEMRASGENYGWRTAAVDNNANFTESPAERFSKTEEWVFVTTRQFADVITPALIAKPDQAAKLLEDSTECNHTYTTYRDIDRPGPHPSLFLDLSTDNRMFAPMTTADRMRMKEEELALKQAGTSLKKNLPVTSKPNPYAKPKPLTGLPEDTKPVDADPNQAVDPVSGATVKRQVKYWVIMSLPSLKALPPLDAKSDEIYVYRPLISQDLDGIQRRISINMNPESRAEAAKRMQEALAKLNGDTAPVPNKNGIAPMPEEPAAPAQPAGDTSATRETPAPVSDPSRTSSKGPRG